MREEKNRDFTGMKKLLIKATEVHNIPIDIDVFKNSDDSNILITDSYYSLINGYQRALEKDPGSEQFLDNMSLLSLDQLYFLENELSAALFQSILNIEKKFKTAIQYVVSKRIGTNAIDEYLQHDAHFYLSLSNERNGVKKILTKLLKKSTGYYYDTNLDPTSPIPPYKEHPSQSLKEYRRIGNVPPWILVNDLTFGEAFMWYKSLQPKLKQEIIYLAFPRVFSRHQTYDSNINFITKSLGIIKQFRNGFAHGDVINKINPTIHFEWNTLSRYMNLTKVVSVDEYSLGTGHSDLLILYITVYMLGNNRSFDMLINKTSVILDQINHNFDSTDLAHIRKVFNIPSNMEQRILNLKTTTV